MAKVANKVHYIEFTNLFTDKLAHGGFLNNICHFFKIRLEKKIIKMEFSSGRSPVVGSISKIIKCK